MDVKKFLNFLIYKYPELKDLISFLPGSIFSKYIKEILSINITDPDGDEFNIISNPEYKEIYLFMCSGSKQKRIKFFKNYLSQVIQDVYKDNTDDLYHSMKALEKAYDEYQQNFSTYSSDEDLFKKIMTNGEFIKFGIFSNLYDFNVSKATQQIIIGGRYGVGKTVMSVNLIIDLILHNKDINIYYFGTNEVSRDKFIERMMVNMSSYNINEINKGLNDEQIKKRNLEDIARMLDYDLLTSIKHLRDNLDISFYEMLMSEYKDITARKEDVNTNIQNITKEYISPKQVQIKEKKIEKESSVLASLNLKETSTKKNFIQQLHISSSVRILNILREMYSNMGYSEAKDASEVNIDEQEISGINFASLIEPKNDADIEKLLSELQKIGKFFDTLESSKLKKSVQENIKKTYDSLIKDCTTKIDEFESILHKEYMKVVRFLGKEHVEIHDNLNINKIEQILKLAREKDKNKKMVVIVDYQQKVEGLGTNTEYEHSTAVGARFLDICTDYNAFGIMMSQLNSHAKDKTPGQKGPAYRPQESNIRGGEGVAQNIGAIGIIFNRDYFDIEISADSQVDKSFVIYEIYFTKNRYGQDGYSGTVEYFIFDKKKLNYIPINKKFHKILNDNKEIQFLSQLKDAIKQKYPYITDIDRELLE